MDDDEKQAILRDFAEKLISGEFKHVALVMIDEDDDVHTFHSGGRITAIGLLRHAEFVLLNQAEL